MPETKPTLPPFEKQTEVITEMLNDMVEEKMVSQEAIHQVAFEIVCDNLSKLPRKDYKRQYKQIELVSKVFRAKLMNDSTLYGDRES